MVVAAHPIAAAAGADVLREGGNAVDASVAVALCLGVVEPYASGLGGGGFMMICPRGDLSKTEILDSRGRVPSLLTKERVYSRGKPIPWPPYSGPMSAAVPGLGRALALALQRFGSLPLSRLVEPAIRASEEGFEVSETYRHCSQMFEGTMRVDEECCRIFMKDGMVMRPGDRLVQPDMARTLRTIARDGFETLYTGEIARAILATVNRTGPLWGDRDLETYPVRQREPLRARIGEFELLVTGPPSRGGAGVVQIAQTFPRGADRPPHNSARAIAFYDRALPAVFRALEDRIGDPDEMPAAAGMLTAPELLQTAAGGSPGTTHYTIVDREGTIVTASQTIGHFFGSGVVVRGWGIVLNDDITDMAPRPDHPNSISANRRSVANMNPMIVARAGRPWVAMGTPGSRRITAALSQVTVNLIAYGQELASAVAQPRLHWEAGTLYLEGGFAEAEIEAARRIVSSRIVRRGPLDLYFGGIHAAAIEGRTVIGVADPRRDGVALAIDP